MHRRPIGSPLASSTISYSPARNRPSPQHATSAAHCRRSQPSAHSAAAADARSVPLRSSNVSCVIFSRLGASDAAPAALIRLPARTAAPSARRSQAPRPATAPCATASARNTHHHQRIAGVRKLTAQLPTMHAAHRRSAATSAASSCRDSVPARLPPHLRSRCLHAPPPHRLAARKPNHPLQPQAQPPQPATRSIISALPAFATTRSQRSCNRRTQRTSEVQPRQLRHPSETRCQRRCPSCSDVILCTHRRPIGSPIASPTIRYSPKRNRPSPQHAASSAHCRRSQPPAHIAAATDARCVSAAAADARSVPLRSSFVSCVILPRLGASDVAPSSPIKFPARTAAPSARPSQAPPSATGPQATAPAHSTQHHQRIACARKHLLTAQLPPTQAAYG
jgi:hypothetical protein